MSHAKQLSSKKVVDIEEHEKVYEGNVNDYDATYALPKKILKTVGFRILINDTNIASICWNLYFWFNLINVLLATILESINMFLMASVGTFLDLFTMMPCVGYLLVATAKAYKIKRYRSVYENLVYELRDMWPSGRITEEEHKIINEALIRLRFVVKAYFSCNMTLGSIFTVPPFISYIRNKAGFGDEIMLPFFYWLPYDPCIGNRFEITMFLQTCHCFLAAGFMLSGDLLFCTFLSHITTQFALLAVRINKLIYVPIDDQLIESYPLGMYSKLHLTYGQMNDEEKGKKLNAELISIILRHRALIRLSSDVENMYSFSLLVNFLNSSIIICFCLFCCARQNLHLNNMSNKRNKEIEKQESESEEDQDSGSEKDSDFDSDGNFVGDKELQADFEGRNPEDCDFHGIKQLLRQLFLKSNVDLGGLAQIIISQNYVGSVVKQCLDDGQDEDDDEDDGSDGVFGITTVLNITKRKEENCIKQIRTLLTTLANDNADDRTKGLVSKILSDEANHVGLVINERILNIPAAISVPLFSSLQSELDKALKKNMPYNFQYLIWICKTYKTGDDESDILFANQEEKPLAEESLASFDVDVTEQADLSQWDYDGGAMTPCRKILIFEGKKFNHLIRLLKEEVESV
ncbi:unnamed protein product, partial [Brenthis ino]